MTKKNPTPTDPPPTIPLAPPELPTPTDPPSSPGRPPLPRPEVENDDDDL